MRPRLVISGIVVIVAIAAVAVVLRAGDGGAAADSATSATTAGKTAAVEQKDLVRSQKLDGVVGHGEQEPLRLSGNGTITRLPKENDIIQFGQPIAEVDGSPVVLLKGDRPAWRTLGPGITKG